MCEVVIGALERCKRVCGSSICFEVSTDELPIVLFRIMQLFFVPQLPQPSCRLGRV
jgi:hypothetical protein